MITWSDTEKHLDVFEAAVIREAAVETAGDENIRHNLELKRLHTFKVREAALAVAEAEGFSGDEKICASYAALAHDFGRFEQFRRYRTFYDGGSVNHAELGVSIMRRLGVPSGIPEDFREMIYRIVLRHNQRKLEAIDDPFERRLSMLIRDADKIDILRVLSAEYRYCRDNRKAAYELKNEPVISPEVRKYVESGSAVPYSELRTVPDFVINVVGWINDLNFSGSRRLFREGDFIADAREILREVPGGTELMDGIFGADS